MTTVICNSAGGREGSVQQQWVTVAQTACALLAHQISTISRQILTELTGLGGADLDRRRGSEVEEHHALHHDPRAGMDE